MRIPTLGRTMFCMFLLCFLLPTVFCLFCNLSRYVEGFLPTPGDFYKNRILIKVGFEPTFKASKSVPDHVKLSFLSAALDPQEMARRYWSYEGFMPISWLGLIVCMCKFVGF